jgi:glycogen synthase
MTTEAGREETAQRASTSLGRAWARISGSGIRHVLMTANTVDGVWPYALTLAGALSRRGVRTSLAVFTAGLPPSLRAEAWAVPGLQIFEGRLCSGSLEDGRQAGDWLLSLARVLRPDVVHLNDAVHGELGWPMPAIVVVHGCSCLWWEAVHGAAAPAESHGSEVRRGLVGAARVVTTSKAMLGALERHHGPLPTGRVVPNARPPSPVRGLEKEPWVLASGSPGDAASNVEVLGTASRTVPIRVSGEAEDPSGEGSRRGGLQLVGRLGPESMRVAMARAAVYAEPALVEPFGLAALDAALQGCALVLSDLPSLRETWDGAAIFVPPHDGEAWAAELRKLIEDVPRRRRLAEAARTRAGDFRPERQAEEMLRIYEGARSEARRESAP